MVRPDEAANPDPGLRWIESPLKPQRAPQFADETAGALGGVCHNRGSPCCGDGSTSGLALVYPCNSSIQRDRAQDVLPQAILCL